MASLSRIPFSPTAERMVSQLARWMSFVGGIHIAAGVFMLSVSLSVAGVSVYGALSVSQFPTWVFALVAGFALIYALFALVLLGEAALLFSARTSLAAVADTDVADQQHLSETFQKLKFYFSLEVALGIISVVASFAQIGLAFASRTIVPLVRELSEAAGS